MSQGKVYEVVITANGGATGGVTFTMDSDLLTNNGRLRFKKSSNSMKRSDYYLIIFLLNDQTTGNDLGFVSNMTNVVYAQGNSTVCPPPSGSQYGEFVPFAVVNPKTLIVKNYDRINEDFSFVLNFERSSAPGILVPYDPIGENRNGGTFLSAAAMITAAAAAGAAAGACVMALTGS